MKLFVIMVLVVSLVLRYCKLGGAGCPLVEEDIYRYVKPRQKLDIPIMSTEYAPGKLYGMAH